MGGFVDNSDVIDIDPNPEQAAVEQDDINVELKEIANQSQGIIFRFKRELIQ